MAMIMTPPNAPSQMGPKMIIIITPPRGQHEVPTALISRIIHFLLGEQDVDVPCLS